MERYSYDVFGEPNRTSDVNNPYLFTGRRYDPETALYYYRARYYAYDIGRFLQPDPIGYDDGMNLYTYVGNNPITFIDPIGFKIVISDEATWRDKRAYRKAIKELSKSTLFRNTYEYLAREDTPLVFVTFPSSKKKADSSQHWPLTDRSSMIYWNRYEEMETNRGRQSPIIALAHEMEHARIRFIGGIHAERIEINGQMINPVEENYIIQWFERPIAKELGEPWRENYLEPYRVEQRRCGKGCPKK